MTSPGHDEKLQLHVKSAPNTFKQSLPLNRGPKACPGTWLVATWRTGSEGVWNGGGRASSHGSVGCGQAK